MSKNAPKWSMLYPAKVGEAKNFQKVGSPISRDWVGISEKEKKLDKLQYEIPVGNSGFFLIRKSWTPPSGVCSFWVGRAGRARGVLDISADNDQKTW